MVTENETKVIDSEFVTYGPMGFDIGMTIGNLLMAYYAQPGHASKPGERVEYQEWILGAVNEFGSVFCGEFSRLWREERTGILYQKALYEDQGHVLASEQTLGHRLNAIWQDTLGFAGIEMHRRILGLAHIAEYDGIENEDLRAACEARGLVLGRQLVVNRGRMGDMAAVLDLARAIGKEECA